MAQVNIAPFDWKNFPFEEVNILIFGKPKQGKSSLGNLILGNRLLDVNRKPGQDTEPWSCACSDVDGKRITVLDIPGHLPMAEELMSQMLLPGLHALLFVINGATSFTKHDQEYFEGFLKIIDNDVIKHIIPIVTHFDQIDNCEQTYIQDTVNNNRYLKDVFRRCDQRYALIDNSPQRSSEDGQRIKQQQRLVLNVLSNLVRTQKTMMTSQEILDKVFEKNDKERSKLVGCLLQTDKQLLVKIAKKLGRTIPEEIRVLLQDSPSKEMKINYRVLKEVRETLDGITLDSEMRDMATVITQHIDLLTKYDMTVASASPLFRKPRQAVATMLRKKKH